MTATVLGASTDTAPDPAAPRPLDRRTAARIAGTGYVAIFVLAIFANFVARERLVVADDAAATAANIAASNGLFRLGIVAFLAIFLIDVVVALAIHVVFRGRHPDVSLLAAWFRIVYTLMLGVAAVFLFQALVAYESAPVGEVVGVAERNVQALTSLEMFDAAWMIGLAAFGVHLVILGWLVARAADAPRRLGPLLVVAGAAYVVDTTALAVVVDYDDIVGVMTAMVAVPSVIAEGWLGMWLLLRAGRTDDASASTVSA